jgi:hypothetical protein
MDSVQERLLWERIIREDLEERSEFLFDVAALAKTAIEAHHLSIVWCVKAKAHQLTEESRRFAGWQRRFLTECQERSWIDKHSLQQALLDALATCFDRLNWPRRVAFAGHTRLNPAERKLQALLQLRESSCLSGRQRHNCEHWLRPRLQTRPSKAFHTPTPMPKPLPLRCGRKTVGAPTRRPGWPSWYPIFRSAATCWKTRWTMC